ncbi:hypothetical protein C8024_00290 [Sphingopyxis sp. BSNA05]|nr:hypothetical protein [Sphingopyxis sp. BSNA05]
MAITMIGDFNQRQSLSAFPACRGTVPPAGRAKTGRIKSGPLHSLGEGTAENALRHVYRSPAPD